jgi:hypothetical protein
MHLVAVLTVALGCESATLKSVCFTEHATVPLNCCGHGTTSIAKDRGGNACPITILLSLEACHDAFAPGPGSPTGLRFHASKCRESEKRYCGDAVALGTNVEVIDGNADGVTNDETDAVECKETTV